MRDELVIRKYKPEDRGAIRKICCDTAFMGKPAEEFFDDRELLADVVSSYYTDFEPESTFIAEAEGRVVGYLTGCKDTKKQKRIFFQKIFPKILLRFIIKGTFLRRKTRQFLYNCLKSFLKVNSISRMSLKITLHTYTSI